MLKRDNYTHEEIVAFLKLNRCDENTSHISKEFVEGINHILEHLIDEFSDPNLAYNTETGFFDYIGPQLPR